MWAPRGTVGFTRTHGVALLTCLACARLPPIPICLPVVVIHSATFRESPTCTWSKRASLTSARVATKLISRSRLLRSGSRQTLSDRLNDPVVHVAPQSVEGMPTGRRLPRPGDLRAQTDACSSFVVTMLRSWDPGRGPTMSVPLSQWSETQLAHQSSHLPPPPLPHTHRYRVRW